MQAALTESRQDEAVAFMCRHLVGLFVTYRHKTEEDAALPPRFAACSGTLIMIRGVCCYLTAGHVLKDLEELRASPQAEIVGATLADTFGLEPASKMPIPFDLKNARFFYVDDEAEGLDFGVIALEPHYVRLLAKNGVIALTEERWIHQERVEFNGYAMLGFPEEFASSRICSSGFASVSPTFLGIKKLDAAPEGRTPTRHPQFIGQLGDKSGLQSVKGMSGGPIFGFRLGPDGKLHYWIVALQSMWNSEKRIVYGCSLPVLASLMTKWTDEAISAA